MSIRGQASSDVMHHVIPIAMMLLVVFGLMIGFWSDDGYWTKLMKIFRQDVQPELHTYEPNFYMSVPDEVREQFTLLSRAMYTRGDECWSFWLVPRSRGMGGYGFGMNNIEDDLNLILYDSNHRRVATVRLPNKRSCVIGVNPQNYLIDYLTRYNFEACHIKGQGCTGSARANIANYADSWEFSASSNPSRYFEFRTPFNSPKREWEGKDYPYSRALFLYTTDGNTCPVVPHYSYDNMDGVNGELMNICDLPCDDHTTCQDFTIDGAAACLGRPCNLNCHWDGQQCLPEGAAYGAACINVESCRDYESFQKCEQDLCRLDDRNIGDCYPFFNQDGSYSHCDTCFQGMTCAEFPTQLTCGRARQMQYCDFSGGDRCNWNTQEDQCQ